MNNSSLWRNVVWILAFFAHVPSSFRRLFFPPLSLGFIDSYALTNWIKRFFRRKDGKTRLDRRYEEWGEKKKNCIPQREIKCIISRISPLFAYLRNYLFIYSKTQEARYEVFHNWPHSRDIFHFAWSISCSIAFLSKNGWVEKLVLVTDQASWHLLAREIWSIDNDNADTRL